tara:strand:+ start:42 stop:551 length:510 start_codon:yes stop_codon:yes gene_type:complete
MTLHPVEHRKLWLENLVKDNSLTKGAELGVQEGVTLKHLIETCPNLHMIGVDTWNPNDKDDALTYIKFYDDLMNWQWDYRDRTRIFRLDTKRASQMVLNDSLDFVFIDADHTPRGVRQDIIDWTPKVKSGGWITGHDWIKAHIPPIVKELLPWSPPILGQDMTWGVKKI